MATLRQRKERWQARVQRRGFENITKSFILKSDAMQWARSVEIEIDRGTFLNNHLARKTSFADIIQRYIKEVAPQLKSFYGETYRLAKLAKHPIAQYKMAELTSARIAIYRDERLREVSNGTVRRELSIISSIIEYARSEWNQNLASNPVSEIKKPKSSRSRNRILSDGEKERLLLTLEQYNPLMKLVVEFALENEARTVFVNAKLRKELQYYIRATPYQNLADKLFYTQKNEGFTANTLTQFFYYLYRSANIDGATSHSGRRTFITTLANKGVSVRLLASLVGHKNISTTQFYIDVNDDMKRSAVELAY